MFLSWDPLKNIFLDLMGFLYETRLFQVHRSSLNVMIMCLLLRGFSLPQGNENQTLYGLFSYISLLSLTFLYSEIVTLQSGILNCIHFLPYH